MSRSRQVPMRLPGPLIDAVQEDMKVLRVKTFPRYVIMALLYLLLSRKRLDPYLITANADDGEQDAYLQFLLSYRERTPSEMEKLMLDALASLKKMGAAKDLGWCIPFLFLPIF